MSIYNVNLAQSEIEFANVKQNSLIALAAFHEYVSNSLTKVRDFLRSDVSSNSIISVAAPTSENASVLVAIDRDTYQSALSDLDGETTLYDSAGNAHILSNEFITDYLMDSVSELAVQKEYIGCCLAGITFTVTDFITRVKGLYPGVSGEIIGKYANLIDNNSLISSITNIFQLNRFIKVEKDQSDVITIYSTDGYTGQNVWLVALQQIGDQIASFFVNVVWKGITKIGEFFRSILEGLKKMAMWIMGRLCSNLLTNYSKSSSSIGIIDFPITQVCFGKIEDFNSETGDFFLNIDYNLNSYNTNLIAIANSALGVIYDYNHINLKDYDHVQLSYFRSFNYRKKSNTNCLRIDSNTALTGMWNIYAENIYQMIYALVRTTMITDDKEGHKAIRPLDITIPVTDSMKYIKSKFGGTWNFECTPMDITLRFGLDDNNYIWMQLFMSDTYEMLHSFTDSQNYNRMFHTIEWLPQICGFSCMTVPQININVYDPSAWTTDYYTPAYRYGFDYGYVKLLFPGIIDLTNEGTYDLIGNLGAVNMMETLYAYSSSSVSVINHNNYCTTATDGLALIYALVSYACYNSKMHEMNLLNDSVDIKLRSTLFNSSLNYSLNSPALLFYDINTEYTYQDDSHGQYTPCYIYDYTGFEDNWSNGINENLFIPYQKSELVPVSIHYQNLNEQAAEIRNAIWTIIIAAAVIYATVKIVKFTKNRKIQTQLAQAVMDQASWDYAKEPNAANYAKFIKSRKKFKKMSLMNHILGIGASASISNTSSNFDTLFENLRGVQDGDQDTSIKGIATLIKG